MYQKNLSYFSLFLLTLAILNSSCENKNTATISDSAFIEIYTDILIIRELRVEPDIKGKLIANLLAHKNVTMEQILAKKEMLNETPEKWVAVLEKVRSRLDQLTKEANKPSADILPDK